MTRTHSYTIAAAFVSLFTVQATAASNGAPVTRKQVRAELAEAVRTGNVILGESSLRLNEQFPQNYPLQQNVPSKSREQVKAELAQAIRTGNISEGESGQKLNEQFPNQFPAQENIASKTHEQVNAELVEAISTGHIGAYIEA
jgi:ribosomal protein L30E